MYNYSYSPTFPTLLLTLSSLTCVNYSSSSSFILLNPQKLLFLLAFHSLILHLFFLLNSLTLFSPSLYNPRSNCIHSYYSKIKKKMSINVYQWQSTLFILFLSLNPIFSLSAETPSPSPSSLLPSDTQISNSPSPLSDAFSPSDNVSDALSPSSAPSPSPSSGNNLSNPSSPSPSPSPSDDKNISDAFSPSPSPSVDNTNTPSSSPSPSPSSLPSPADALTPSSSPSPSPDAGDVGDVSVTESHAQTDASKKSDGMNGGHKAGVAFGVIGAACVVGFAGWIYKKRQDNLRRSQYGYNARTTMI